MDLLTEHNEGLIVLTDCIGGPVAERLVPLRRDRRKGHDGRGLVTEWDGTDCDVAGLLKLDVLGIRNLDVIAATEQIIAERTGERVAA
ncbi:MAG: hypothetical protein ACYCTE_16825, partial [Acidimicrobiales bacterium]